MSKDMFHTPTLGAFPSLTGGSGGRPLWRAATAEPLQTFLQQPNIDKNINKKNKSSQL